MGPYDWTVNREKEAIIHHGLLLPSFFFIQICQNSIQKSFIRCSSVLCAVKPPCFVFFGVDWYFTARSLLLIICSLLIDKNKHPPKPNLFLSFVFVVLKVKYIYNTDTDEHSTLRAEFSLMTLFTSNYPISFLFPELCNLFRILKPAQIKV